MLLEVLVVAHTMPVLLNEVFDDEHVGYRAKACDGFAIWANQKFGEVPFQVARIKNSRTRERKKIK